MLIETSGAHMVHMDVMDGVFVPNITFGHKMVQDIRKRTKLPLDVHLMVVNPENQIRNFIDAGADMLTFHIEASVHAHRTITMIRESGISAGISLVPSTPVSSVSEILEFADLVLVMTVNPGFGGQKMITGCVRKIAELAEIREKKGYHYRISVDGGVNAETAPAIRRAGADILVSGSVFFNAEQPDDIVKLLSGKN